MGAILKTGVEVNFKDMNGDTVLACVIDNRDNSQDSRFIGLIPRETLVGRAEIVFVSFDVEIGSFIKFWTWFPALRKDRLIVSLLPEKENE